MPDRVILSFVFNKAEYYSHPAVEVELAGVYLFRMDEGGYSARISTFLVFWREKRLAIYLLMNRSGTKKYV